MLHSFACAGLLPPEIPHICAVHGIPAKRATQKTHAKRDTEDRYPPTATGLRQANMLSVCNHLRYSPTDGYALTLKQPGRTLRVTPSHMPTPWTSTVISAFNTTPERPGLHPNYELPKRSLHVPAPAGSRYTFEFTFPLPGPDNKGGGRPKSNKKTGTGKLPTRTTSKAKKPKQPTVPDPLQAEVKQQRRDEYDRRRNQSPERKDQYRRYAQQRHQRAKENGNCRNRSIPAIPGQTRCEAYAEKHR